MYFGWMEFLVLGHFVGRRADYLFMLIFNWGCLVLIGLFAEIAVSLIGFEFETIAAKKNKEMK